MGLTQSDLSHGILTGVNAEGVIMARTGGWGNDVILGGAGRDILNGGPGADTLVDTSGATLVRIGASGRGEDTVDVLDGRANDTVICGSRRSTVFADRRDRVSGQCGNLIRR
jgi:Ca2+-binding RTX toxin-like protein